MRSVARSMASEVTNEEEYTFDSEDSDASASHLRRNSGDVDGDLPNPEGSPRTQPTSKPGLPDCSFANTSAVGEGGSCVSPPDSAAAVASIPVFAVAADVDGDGLSDHAVEKVHAGSIDYVEMEAGDARVEGDKGGPSNAGTQESAGADYDIVCLDTEVPNNWHGSATAVTQHDSPLQIEGGVDYVFGRNPDDPRCVAKDLLRWVLMNIANRPGSEDDEQATVTEFEEPSPEPEVTSMTWLELRKGVLKIHEEPTQLFLDEGDYVNIIMVFGKLRTGKSYLMNALSGTCAFGVSDQARSFTQGIHVASRFLPCTSFGGPADAPKIGFVDAEGQADKGKSYDIKIATPMLLVAKIIILNEICPTGPSKEDILRLLEIMMRAAEQVSDSSGRKKLFGNLHLILRDCAQDESECWSIVFDQEDIEEAETPEQEGAMQERNKIRESICQSFESMPLVWCLPKLSGSTAPEDYRDAHPDYVDKVDEMRLVMSRQLVLPKLLDGKPLTGAMIGALMPQLQEALKADSPILNPPTMMQAVCDMEASRIELQMSLESERRFKEFGRSQLPLEQPFFDGELDIIKAELAAEFKIRLRDLPESSIVRVYLPFAKKFDLLEEQLVAMNREKQAEKAALEAEARMRRLEEEKEAEIQRTQDALRQIDRLMEEREEERSKADEALKQIEELEAEREKDKLRFDELEHQLEMERSDREQQLLKQIEEEQERNREREQALKDEEEKHAILAEEQRLHLEEQQRQIDEMEKQMEEDRKAREEAEAELGVQKEEMLKEDQQAQLAESAAEAKQEPPVIYAARQSDLLAVRGLLRREPGCVRSKDKNSRTALHFAAVAEVGEALLEKKADPNHQDMGMWTPLHHAANNGNNDVVELLVDSDANLSLTTQHGNTALDLAYNQQEVATTLLNALADPIAMARGQEVGMASTLWIEGAEPAA